MTDTERQQHDYRRGDARFKLGFFVAIAAIMIGVAFLVYKDGAYSKAQRVRFMQQCMEDHEEYECTYLWRSSERPASDVVHIPHSDPDEVAARVQAPGLRAGGVHRVGRYP